MYIYTCICMYVYMYMTRGYGHYLTFWLPFPDPSGHSFTVQKSIPGTFCTFQINCLQANVCMTVLVTKLGTKNYGSNTSSMM